MEYVKATGRGCIGAEGVGKLTLALIDTWGVKVANTEIVGVSAAAIAKITVEGTGTIKAIVGEVAIITIVPLMLLMMLSPGQMLALVR